MASIITQHALRDDRWTNYILWHLTRMGEPTVLATRHFMPVVLSTDLRLTKSLAQKLTPFGEEFEPYLRKTNAYEFYGSEGAFRQKVQNDTVENPALQLYGTALGQVLSSGDEAWTALMNANQ